MPKFTITTVGLNHTIRLNRDVWRDDEGRATTRGAGRAGPCTGVAAAPAAEEDRRQAGSASRAIHSGCLLNQFFNHLTRQPRLEVLRAAGIGGEIGQ